MDWIVVLLHTEYRTRVHCKHMYHLFCNALDHVTYQSQVNMLFKCHQGNVLLKDLCKN